MSRQKKISITALTIVPITWSLALLFMVYGMSFSAHAQVLTTNDSVSRDTVTAMLQSIDTSSDSNPNDESKIGSFTSDRLFSKAPSRRQSPDFAGECIPPPCELPAVDCDRIKKLKARCKIQDKIGFMRVKIRRRVTEPYFRIDESVLIGVNLGREDELQCCMIFFENQRKAKLRLDGRIGPQQVQILEPQRCPLQAQADCGP